MPPTRLEKPSTLRNDWQTIRSLLPCLWEFKGHVAAAPVLLLMAKLPNVAVPLVLKELFAALDHPQTPHHIKNLRDSLAICARLVVTMPLLTVYSPPALGQSSLPEPPSRSKPASAPQTEINDSAEENDDAGSKRRILSRLGPQHLTPEQLKEAERIRQQAAKFGTDPTAIVGRVQFTSQYVDAPEGGRVLFGTGRVDVPFQRNYVLSVSAPYVSSSIPDRSGATTTTQGFGDVSILTAWRAYNTPEYAVLLGVTTTLPTAEDARLGLGRYTVGPTLATARFLPRWKSLLIGSFTQQISVAGDSVRNPVNLSRALIQVNTIWAEQWWTIAQATWQVDWERSTAGSMTLELELGRNVAGKLGVFVRPGVGIFGQNLRGAYDWNIEGGVRYMFPSF